MISGKVKAQPRKDDCRAQTLIRKSKPEIRVICVHPW